MGLKYPSRKNVSFTRSLVSCTLKDYSPSFIGDHEIHVSHFWNFFQGFFLFVIFPRPFLLSIKFFGFWDVCVFDVSCIIILGNWFAKFTWIGLRAEQIFSVNIYYTYFSILGVTFTFPFLCYFQKLQLLVKTFSTNFCCIVLLYLWAQNVCLRFLKSYFKLEILIFLSFVVSFLVDMFN